jgi:hypothetical protein
MNNTTMRRECLAGHDESLLKAMVDGELADAWQAELRQHAAGCEACSERLMRLRMDGALVHGRMAMLADPLEDRLAAVSKPSVAALLARAKASEAPPVADGWLDRVAAALVRLSQPVFGSLRPLPLAGGTAAAAVLLGLSFTQPAVQSFAQGIVQSLRVQKVEPVKIDPAFLRGLPISDRGDLSKLGTYSGPTEPRIRAANVQEAARTTGLQLRAPATLPGTLRNTQTIYVSEGENFSFTYDGAKLVQEAQNYGVRDAALLNELRALNGVTVKGNVPAAAAMFFGTPPVGQQGQAPSAQGARAAATQAPASPFAALVQMKSPTLDVPPTVNADRLRDVLLKSGALPPQLANQLLAIQDWRTTLPIPVTRGTATQVQVDGTTGTLVTGELPVPVLVWQKDGVLHVLTGTLSEADLLAAARSLQPAR